MCYNKKIKNLIWLNNLSKSENVCVIPGYQNIKVMVLNIAY
jgi:hypothetical protein